MISKYRKKKYDIADRYKILQKVQDSFYFQHALFPRNIRPNEFYNEIQNENSRLISNSESHSNCELQSYFADDSKSASSVLRNFRIRFPVILKCIGQRNLISTHSKVILCTTEILCTEISATAD